MHHQLQTLDSPSVLTFSTKRPRMLVPRSFIAQNAPTESCRCTTRIPWYHQNPAYAHRILFPLTAWIYNSTSTSFILVICCKYYGFQRQSIHRFLMKFLPTACVIPQWVRPCITEFSLSKQTHRRPGYRRRCPWPSNVIALQKNGTDQRNLRDVRDNSRCQCA